MPDLLSQLPFAGCRQVVSAAGVRDAWNRLATELQPLISREPCVLIGVLLGGVVPLVKISERLQGDFLLDYCHLSRYQGATTGGQLCWVQHPRLPLRDRTVVLVDDIFDEGHTLRELKRYCLEQGARRVLIAVMVRKRHDRAVADVQPDFVGMEVDDQYVFGCGMDYAEHWRHLDAIYALTETAG